MSTDKSNKYTKKVDITQYELLQRTARHYQDIYQHLSETLGKEQTQTLYLDAAERKWGEWTKQATKDNPIQDFEGFKEFMKEGMKRMEERFLELSLLADAEDRLEYRVTKCMMAEVYNGLGLSDLGYAVTCHSDFPITENAHPCAKLHRDNTLMQGGPYCDFLYTWEEE
jgi:glucan phosphorylase